MKELIEAVTGLLSAPVLIIGALILLLIVAGILGWGKVTLPGGIGASKADPTTAAGSPVTTDTDARVSALRIDMEQYGEVATALSALLAASPTDVEQAARHWFSELATRLATRLREERHHHYRVAIWLDDESNPTAFLGIGHGLFDTNDTDMDSLERQYTIGGLAFTSPNMTYYCRDRRTDPNFKPRRNIPPSFESVFGLALGTYTNRWGVMTVDARQVNGFPARSGA